MLEDLKKINKAKSEPEILRDDLPDELLEELEKDYSNSLKVKKESNHSLSDKKYFIPARESLNKEEIKKEEADKEEIKREEVKKEEVNKEDAKKEEVKKEEVKKEEVKKEEVKREDFKKEEEIEIGEVVIKPTFSDKIKKAFSKKLKNNLELLNTDLIKDEVEIRFDWSSNLASFLLLFILSFIIVAEASVIFKWWGQEREEVSSLYLEEEISYIKGEIEKIKPEYDQAVEFSDRLKLSTGALQRHIYWNNFFALLETNTLKNIYYRNFSGNIYGKYVLPAVSNNVLAISYQSKVFSASDMVLDTSVSDESIINIEEEGQDSRSIINFNFNLDLNEMLFKQ
jgi:hypothetical protein